MVQACKKLQSERVENRNFKNFKVLYGQQSMFLCLHFTMWVDWILIHFQFQNTAKDGFYALGDVCGKALLTPGKDMVRNIDIEIWSKKHDILFIVLRENSMLQTFYQALFNEDMFSILSFQCVRQCQSKILFNILLVKFD